MAHLILVRGLPGSGKTTFAKQLESYWHVEADQFFEVDGQYLFDPKSLSEAHAWCLAETKAELERGGNVVVSNTFTQRWEAQPYLDLGCPTSIVTTHGNYGSVHDVPAHTINKMRQRWENF